LDSCYGFLLTEKKGKKRRVATWLLTDVGTDEQQADV
jgi:hypothetical protein